MPIDLSAPMPFDPFAGYVDPFQPYDPHAGNVGRNPYKPMNIEDVRQQYPAGWFDSRTPAEQQRILRKHAGWSNVSIRKRPLSKFEFCTANVSQLILRGK